MKLLNVLACLSVTAQFVSALEVEQPADKVTFDALVSPFLTKHCTSCHGEEKAKGKIRLHKIDYDLASSKDLETWQQVLEMLQLKEMPPEDEPQPSDQERAQVVDWINTELFKSGNGEAFKQKMEQPRYGNYVDHDKLFSGEIKDAPYSPARLWRRSPYHFDQTKPQVFGSHLKPKDVNGSYLEQLKQPFHKGDGEGISDYAALLYADSATFDTLYRNAEFAVDIILGGSAPKPYKDILEKKDSPSKAEMEAAIRYHFQTTLQEEPSQEDLAKYSEFMSAGIAKEGSHFGLRNVLIAISVSPKYIYRSELGLGEPIADGRRMLSPVELAYAISYALTDSPPDDKLRDAAKNGQLNSREDVKREVVRLLGDGSIAKPRIMRFFHEFFGYNRAPEVFKEDVRFFGGFTYFKAARYYVGDTDTLIQYILKDDKEVFKKLLSTEEYFIGHHGNNEEVKAEVEAHRKLYAYFKDKNWRSYGKKGNEPTKEDIAYAMSLHPSFRGVNTRLANGKAISSKMAFLDPFEKKGITPLTYTMKRTSEPMFKGLAAYNIPNDGKDWDFPVEQPFVLAEGKRAGILSHPSWLIAHSLNAHTDPVRRGKWIRERLLAGTVPDVPITVDASVPEDHHKTLRERYSVTEAESCWKCHVKMNPLGYTFESFDDFGRWRDQESMEGLPKVGNKFQTKPLNTKGFLEGTGDSKLDGPVEDHYDLIQRLAKSRRVQQSFIRHSFRYWMGRNEMLSDSQTLIQAEKDYMDNGGSFNAMLVSLLTSDSFIYRKTVK